MKFEIVNRIPDAKRNTGYNDVTTFLCEFLATGEPYAQVFYLGEYATPGSLYAVLKTACKKHRFPIGVRIRNHDEIYLERKDVDVEI